MNAVVNVTSYSSLRYTDKELVLKIQYGKVTQITLYY